MFAGLPQPLTATRYHSLVVAPESVPEVLEVSAWSEDGAVMGLRHRHLPIEGVQFHPESILTDGGHRMIANWLAVAVSPPLWPRSPPPRPASPVSPPPSRLKPPGPRLGSARRRWAQVVVGVEPMVVAGDSWW